MGHELLILFDGVQAYLLFLSPWASMAQTLEIAVEVEVSVLGHGTPRPKEI